MKKLIFLAFIISGIALMAVPHMGSTWVLNNDGTQANAAVTHFNAWLDVAPGDILTETSGGCNITDQYGYTFANDQV